MVDWEVIRVFVMQDVEALRKRYQFEKALLPDILNVMRRMYFHHLKKYKPRSILNIRIDSLDNTEGK